MPGMRIAKPLSWRPVERLASTSHETEPGHGLQKQTKSQVRKLPYVTRTARSRSEVRRACQPMCALASRAEFGAQSSGEKGFFQKLATVWTIFFPPQKKIESARVVARSRLIQTLGEEEFGLTRQQISAIGQQIGRVLEDFVELDEVPGAQAPVLESKIEGRGKLKVMFKVRRVKPAAEDGWFGDEDGQEWSPYMADDVNYDRPTSEGASKGQPSFEASLRQRGRDESVEWLDTSTLIYRHRTDDRD